MSCSCRNISVGVVTWLRAGPPGIWDSIPDEGRVYSTAASLKSVHWVLGGGGWAVFPRVKLPGYEAEQS
jgi:hypothetical protein